jgi:hypothetical protein
MKGKVREDMIELLQRQRLNVISFVFMNEMGYEVCYENPKKETSGASIVKIVDETKDSVWTISQYY